MITKNDASKIAVLEIEKILKQIEAKFESIEFDFEKCKESFYIKCNLNESNKETTDIVIRFIFDNERQNPTVPENLTEYVNQGGSENLSKKFSSMNKNAWKCEVFSHLKDHQKLRYGVEMNESNFSDKEIRTLFEHYLINNNWL